jgi:hypothetical protein
MSLLFTKYSKRKKGLPPAGILISPLLQVVLLGAESPLFLPIASKLSE